MPKYLLQVSYTAEGARGVAKDGGSKRREAARVLVESVGGKLYMTTQRVRLAAVRHQVAR